MTTANSAFDTLKRARRIVIKIGSALLVDAANGTLRRNWLKALAEDIAALRARGQEVVIVSSGAIALGRRQLGLPQKRLKLEESQAAASVGQIRLAHAYQEVLGEHDITVAQILLTLGDTEERRRYLNARSTINTLLGLGSIPVINENDTVATAEIRYGDNDRLAARVAQMASADCLILLSDVDGLYTADPESDPEAEFVPVVRTITSDIADMAGAPKATGFGKGGMVTKLAAGQIAVAAGCAMAIINGKDTHPLQRFEATGRGTWFLPDDTPITARKQWIAGTLVPAGIYTVDAGAAGALGRGKSLLPAGVTKVEGDFERGDAVRVLDASGREIARGLSAYSSEAARRIIGHKSRDIEAILGYRGREELIHRDDLVLLAANGDASADTPELKKAGA
ncbi:MAG TPA: glutamate 5-kinase [Alphaproteobacteria bacterium]|nr:glutamate 5-kinase [Alphaproteobacteria bacterium]